MFDDNSTDHEMSGDNSTGARAPEDVARIAELERQLADAVPILDAFARLENLARERRTTPEAVAVQVTIDVLEEEAQELKDATDLLEQEKRRHQGDVELLTKKRDAISVEIDGLEVRHGSLATDVGELIGDIDAIRADAGRLMAEKGELELKLEALRNEVEALERDRDAMLSGEAAISARVPSNTAISTEGDDDEAFDKFFMAETGKDKARAWLTK